MHAFTAVVVRGKGHGIGRADKGQPGYTPMPSLGFFRKHDEAKAKADKLNADLGLSTLEAWEIVASTMRIGRAEATNN